MSTINVEPLSETEIERLKKSYPITFGKLGHRYIKTQPGNCVLFDGYEGIKDRLKNWTVRPDDTYVFAFPRSGSTWAIELAWCIQHDCNIEAAKSTPLLERVPWMDMQMAGKVGKSILDMSSSEVLPVKVEKNRVETMELLPSPRLMRSHTPFYLFPDDLLDKSKVIVCLRNPKDTVVSYYHFEKLVRVWGYEGDFATYFDLFMDNLVVFSPYFGYVAEAWKRRHHPNLCILFYEDSKLDLNSTIKKVADFLGKELTEKQIENLLDHLSFEKMKANQSVNEEKLQNNVIMSKEGKFIRKGKVGDWKNYFTEEMNKRMDEAIEKHFKPIGLDFRYE